jgi:hypothetical protein
VITPYILTNAMSARAVENSRYGKVPAGTDQNRNLPTLGLVHILPYALSQHLYIFAAELN